MDYPNGERLESGRQAGRLPFRDENSGSRASPGKSPLNIDTTAYIARPTAWDSDEGTRTLPHGLSKLDRG